MSGIHGYPTDPAQSTGTVGTSAGEAGTIITEDAITVKAINNAMRGIAGDLGNWRNDIAAANTSSGSGNAYVLATDSQIGALADGLLIAWLPNHGNTGAATINVDTLGSKKLIASGAALVAGNIVAGQPVIMTYDASADSAAGAWLVANPVPVAASVSYTSDDIGNDSGVTGATVTAALDQLDTDKLEASDIAGKADATITITAGTGLTGGGDLSANRTINADLASQVEAEAGTDNTVLMTPLRTAEAIAALEGGGGLVPIAQAVADDVATVDFTGFDAALYESYLITVRNLKPATSSALYMRVSTDGGDTFDATSSRYNSATHSWGAVSTTPAVSANRFGTTIILSGTATATTPISGEISLIGIDRAAITQVMAEATIANSAGSDATHHTATGMHTLEQVHNAVRLYMSSGNITSGTFTLYGRKAP